jgi:predicted RNase H-like HicB family nuclease
MLRAGGLIDMLGYTVVLEAEKDGGFVVSVPALPGCFTQGESRDEALKNAREAIAAHVEELRGRGEEAPVEVETETQYLELPELEFGM